MARAQHQPVQLPSLHADKSDHGSYAPHLPSTPAIPVRAHRGVSTAGQGNSMKRLAPLLAITFFLFTSALAGRIYGTVKENGRSVGYRIKIEFACKSQRTYSTRTTKTGFYSLFVPTSTKCKITVHYKRQKPFTHIYNVNKNHHYDLVLSKNRYGTYSLKAVLRKGKGK